MKQLFYYEPEQYLDGGGLGEFPIKIKSDIDLDYENGKQTITVTIRQILATLDLKDRKYVVDVTAKLLHSEYSRTAWEEDVLRAYKRG